MRDHLRDSWRELGRLLDFHDEWLLLETATGKSFALRRAEIEASPGREKPLVSFLDARGSQTWRVEAWEGREKSKILLSLSRNFGREHKKIELVPRVSAAELGQAIELSRVGRANRLARLILRDRPGAKLVRVGLSPRAGRLAQIIFENPRGHGTRQTAALADVSGETASSAPERLLTAAVLWLEKLQSRKKNTAETIWVLAEGKSAAGLRKLRALLGEGWRAKIRIFEVQRDDGGAGETRLVERDLELADLWRARPKKKPGAMKAARPSESARQIAALAPGEIDVVYTRSGETLRYLGLPFARVRRILGEEKVWFGTEAGRQLLTERTFDEFGELVENLKIYRRPDSAGKRHAFYRLAPESWLEAVLRKNVRRLDANLNLSPVYHQFRLSAAGDRLDLLALRRDGRLVVVEVKTSPDREMIFQAADYWRRVELYRRAGLLEKAELFGAGAHISNRPALVYLVAPLLAFHRDLNLLARALSPQIEVVRFCLNENWRECLKVVRREVLATSVVQNAECRVQS